MGITNDYEEGGPVPVRLIAVCHTAGCPAEGKECPGTYYAVPGTNPPRYNGQCGQCGQPITDLRVPPDGTEPAPEPTPEPTPPPATPVEPTQPTP